MPKFVIAMGAAPHMKLSMAGDTFSASLTPMSFDSHDRAYAYVLAHTEQAPLQGLRAEIVEDMSLEGDRP